MNACIRIRAKKEVGRRSLHQRIPSFLTPSGRVSEGIPKTALRCHILVGLKELLESCYTHMFTVMVDYRERI